MIDELGGVHFFISTVLEMCLCVYNTHTVYCIFFTHAIFLGQELRREGYKGAMGRTERKETSPHLDIIRLSFPAVIVQVSLK